MDASRGGRKRSLPGEEDDGSEPREASMEKKVRFPKGKKGRRGEERVAVAGEDVDGSFGSWMNPTLAAKERSKRRNQNMEKEVCGDQIKGEFQEILARSEVRYEDNGSFADKTLITCSRDDWKTNLRMQNFDSIMKDAASIGELASYSSEQTSWVKTQFQKIKDKLSGAVTSFIGEVSCTSSKSIGILSPHKRPKRGRSPTNRLKSTVEKYGKSTRKGKGKGTGKEVDLDIVPEIQPSTPRTMSEDQNLPTEIIPARRSVPEFHSQMSQTHYDDFDPRRFSYSGVFCQSDNTESV